MRSRLTVAGVRSPTPRSRSSGASSSHCAATGVFAPSGKETTMTYKATLLAVALATALCFTARGAQEAASHRRLTSHEIEALAQTGPGAGTSGVSGIETRVLKGNPTRVGVYTIQLTVPAHTRIEAHTHPDDRVATVVAGTWYFGYGKRFD